MVLYVDRPSDVVNFVDEFVHWTNPVAKDVVFVSPGFLTSEPSFIDLPGFQLQILNGVDVSELHVTEELVHGQFYFGGGAFMAVNGVLAEDLRSVLVIEDELSFGYKEAGIDRLDHEPVDVIQDSQINGWLVFLFTFFGFGHFVLLITLELSNKGQDSHSDSLQQSDIAVE